MDTASPLALPGIITGLTTAATDLKGEVAAARELLAELLALHAQGDHVATLMARVADLDGMRAAIEAATAAAATAAATATAALADQRYADGWDARGDAPPEAPFRLHAV